MNKSITMKADDSSVGFMCGPNIVAIVFIAIGVPLVILLIIKTAIHNNDKPVILEARKSIEIIREFAPSNKALNKKSRDLSGIATDVSKEWMLCQRKTFDNKGIEKLKALSDTHLSKIVQLIETYTRINRGQLDSHDYPGIEAELDALLDAAKAALILESKSLFKSKKTNGI